MCVRISSSSLVLLHLSLRACVICGNTRRTAYIPPDFFYYVYSIRYLWHRKQKHPRNTGALVVVRIFKYRNGSGKHAALILAQIHLFLIALNEHTLRLLSWCAPNKNAYTLHIYIAMEFIFIYLYSDQVIIKFARYHTYDLIQASSCHYHCW